MVRSIFAAATLLVAGLASFASAATYEDYFLNSEVGATYVAPLSSIQNSLGTVAETKAACDAIADCIAVLYQESANGAVLLRYDPEEGSSGAAAGFTSISWRYGATSGPSCSATLDEFAIDGFCNCNENLEVQNTPYGCQSRLLPSGGLRPLGRRSRNHIMPGRT